MGFFRKRANEDKTFENLRKNVQNVKIFFDYRMQETARICP